MGSPVSPVVVNFCMEEIEETAIDSTFVPPKVWERYVDDRFCIIKKDAVFSFYNSLNRPFYSCLFSDQAYEWLRGCR